MKINITPNQAHQVADPIVGLIPISPHRRSAREIGYINTLIDWLRDAKKGV